MNGTSESKNSITGSKTHRKSCPRCNSIFECKPQNVKECDCSKVPLTGEDFNYIGELYCDCLCTNCLLELKKERLFNEVYPGKAD